MIRGAVNRKNTREAFAPIQARALQRRPSHTVEAGVRQELIQVLLGSPDDQHVPFLEDRVSAWDGASRFLALERQDGKAALAVEMKVGQALSHPLPWNLCLCQGLVLAEVYVVHDGG